MFCSEKTQQEFEEICLQFGKEISEKKGIPSAYSASIFSGFLKAEEKYPNLNKALEVLTNEDYFQKLIGNTRVAREHPINIQWAIEAIYTFRFGEEPTEHDRIPLEDLRREIGEEFIVENEICWD